MLEHLLALAVCQPTLRFLFFGKSDQKQDDRATQNDAEKLETAFVRTEGDDYQGGQPNQQDGKKDGNVFHDTSLIIQLKGLVFQLGNFKAVGSDP
ncbi:hypothetical protein F4X86_00765 [Candidatus Saccharibacteria bacterium]|nr:hypothetical protein [Candidatus Saccharibacteria bacterium]